MLKRVELLYAEATDSGKARSVNQDTVFAGRLKVAGASLRPHLFLVADGMGGYRGGDVASRIAAETFRSLLLQNASSWPEPENSEAWLLMLIQLVRQTNAKVLDEQQTSEYKGMGTTLTAAVECQGMLHIVHVGDSRLYHYDGETMYQITRDHSLVGELLRLGQLTPDEAMRHPRRNVITQALGVAWEIDIEAKSLELSEHSRLLFCSDGLSSMVRDEEISMVLKSDLEPYNQVRALVDLANEQGGKDNISVIISRYRALDHSLDHPIEGSGER